MAPMDDEENVERFPSWEEVAPKVKAWLIEMTRQSGRRVVRIELRLTGGDSDPTRRQTWQVDVGSQGWQRRARARVGVELERFGVPFTGELLLSVRSGSVRRRERLQLKVGPVLGGPVEASRWLTRELIRQVTAKDEHMGEMFANAGLLLSACAAAIHASGGARSEPPPPSSSDGWAEAFGQVMRHFTAAPNPSAASTDGVDEAEVDPADFLDDEEEADPPIDFWNLDLD